MSESEPLLSQHPPFTTRRFWSVVIPMVPIYAVWMVVHWPSCALVNGTIAGLGPVLVFLWAGIRLRDWRFIAIALAYAILPAAFLYRLLAP